MVKGRGNRVIRCKQHENTLISVNCPEYSRICLISQAIELFSISCTILHKVESTEIWLNKNVVERRA